MIIVKLGGSLMPYARKLLFAISSQVSPAGCLADESFAEPILIVPGGGVFADTVRRVYDEYHEGHDGGDCRDGDGCDCNGRNDNTDAECNSDGYSRRGLTQEGSHNMAVLAMEQYGHFLSDISGIPLCDSVDANSKLSILLPARMLSEDRDGCAGMPHTWDTTSDAIAVWVAHKLGAKVIKVTDVDGIIQNGRVLEHVSARELLGWDASCVDSVTPGMLVRYRLDCIVVNGRYPERVIGALGYAGHMGGSGMMGGITGTLIHWKDNI